MYRRGRLACGICQRLGIRLELSAAQDSNHGCRIHTRHILTGVRIPLSIGSDQSRRQYAEHYEPSAQVVAAAKAAGVKRFVYVGVASYAEEGFGGPNPGLYTGKRSAALAARDAFGDAFTYFGPHLVVESNDDMRMKMANSRLGSGLRAVNDAIGAVRSFGLDFTTATRLTPPVLVADLALAIAATVTGKVEVEESVRCAGMTTFDQVKEREQQRIEDVMRHVDGTEAIVALARSAEAAGVRP